MRGCDIDVYSRVQSLKGDGQLQREKEREMREKTVVGSGCWAQWSDSGASSFCCVHVTELSKHCAAAAAAAPAKKLEGDDNRRWWRIE